MQFLIDFNALDAFARKGSSSGSYFWKWLGRMYKSPVLDKYPCFATLVEDVVSKNNGHARTFLNWQLVRNKAAEVAEEMAYKTPELRGRMQYPRGRSDLYHIVPVGSRRCIKKNSGRKQSAALAHYYLQMKKRLPSSSQGINHNDESAEMLYGESLQKMLHGEPLIALFETSLEAGRCSIVKDGLPPQLSKDALKRALLQDSRREIAHPGASRVTLPSSLQHQPELSSGLGVLARHCSSGKAFKEATDYWESPGGTTPGGGGGGTTLKRELLGVTLEPDVSRFVCNPLGGQMFRLPDIDGKKKSLTCAGLGILTQSERPDGPPDRYAVAELSAPDDGAEDWRFFLRRFDSGTGKGEWDKPVALPSPLPLVRRMDIDREPPKGPMEPDLDGYRRMGVSEGRLRYAEVSQKEPFSLSYFALEDDGSTWTLEHRVELSRLLPHEDLEAAEETPRMGVLDPMNTSVIHITLGDQIFSVDMDKKMVLGCVRTSLTLKSVLSAHLKVVRAPTMAGVKPNPFCRSSFSTCFMYEKLGFSRVKLTTDMRSQMS
ncbi:hypothetical protein PR202_ga05402 [Eleusine coracana subsp. coracana]|uniref:DUF1618 domain-containing protein n=1 Tax=Eleusine coracana subsp. coracana TaxID=191504 RepID=A0AAV5BSA2_ELECO|nr:hypothetical protein PR202_ga04949 [Eleusine coracana subsp. coracana]GJM89233.1 hypothetical protein PR202_ga05402 [Eleusine coracana subsp. coracana]